MSFSTVLRVTSVHKLDSSSSSEPSVKGPAENGLDHDHDAIPSSDDMDYAPIIKVSKTPLVYRP